MVYLPVQTPNWEILIVPGMETERRLLYLIHCGHSVHYWESAAAGTCLEINHGLATTGTHSSGIKYQLTGNLKAQSQTHSSLGVEFL